MELIDALVREAIMNGGDDIVIEEDENTEKDNCYRVRLVKH